MSFIKYNLNKKRYYATGKRPNNQNTHAIHEKIASRLLRYIKEHPNTELTELQGDFTDHLENLGKKYRVSMDDINIAHGVAISKIIEVFVYALNHPNKIKTQKWFGFIDNFLSTESSSDDKGRSSIQAFITDVINGFLTPKGILAEVNCIIRKLNCCTRNLSVGFSSPNKSIQEHQDPLLIASKTNPKEFYELKHAQCAATFFKALPKQASYGPRVQNGRGTRQVMTSSLHPDIDDSYVKETVKSDGSAIYRQP